MNLLKYFVPKLKRGGKTSKRKNLYRTLSTVAGWQKKGDEKIFSLWKTIFHSLKRKQYTFSPRSHVLPKISKLKLNSSLTQA